MIIASLVAAFGIGCLLGRLYSYVALLAVSPLVALVAAATAWTSNTGSLKAALLGLGAMALSQIGFLAGVALDPQFSASHRVRGVRTKGSLAKRHQPSAPER